MTEGDIKAVQPGSPPVFPLGIPSRIAHHLFRDVCRGSFPPLAAAAAARLLGLSDRWTWDTATDIEAWGLDIPPGGSECCPGMGEGDMILLWMTWSRSLAE